MLDKHVQARQYLVACFVVSLTKGERIQGRTIRHATIQNYVKAISKLYADQNKVSQYCAEVDYITLVLNAVSTYTHVKYWQDMIHDKARTP
jgi:hypothetical protein